jgi:hypothetical protein
MEAGKPRKVVDHDYRADLDKCEALEFNGGIRTVYCTQELTVGQKKISKSVPTDSLKRS